MEGFYTETETLFTKNNVTRSFSSLKPRLRESTREQLRFFAVCTNYRKFIYQKKSGEIKSSLLPFWKQMSQEFNQRTGIPVLPKHIPILWELCQYQQTYDVNGDFCSLFTDEDVDRLEFAGDVVSFVEKVFFFSSFIGRIKIAHNICTLTFIAQQW